MLRWPWDQALLFLVEAQEMDLEDEEARNDRLAALIGSPQE